MPLTRRDSLSLVGAASATTALPPMPLTPAEFDALIVKEIADNKALVKASGMKIN